MEKCNLIYSIFDTPYRAISFLEKNNYKIESEEETDTVFVLESEYDYPQSMIWKVGKAYGENKKIVILVDYEDEGEAYLESWLFESACAAFNIKTGKEVEIIEI